MEEIKETTVSNTTIFLNALRLHKSIKITAQIAIDNKCLVIWSKDRQAILSKREKDADDITLLDFSADPGNPFIDEPVTYAESDTYMAVSTIDKYDHEGLNAFLSRDYD